MADVLITYGWVRSSYSALRNLHKHDVSVIIADSSRIGMGQFSRLRAGFRQYTSHYQDEKKFIADLVAICRSDNIKVILPSHNETEVIARHRHEFPEELVTLIPEEAHCRLFNNKSTAYDYALDLGVPVPSRINYEDPAGVSEILKKKNIKRTVIKLLTGNSSKGVFYGEDEEHAQYIVESLISKYELEPSRFPQIEEFVEGEGYGCSVLYKNGMFVTSFTHRRLRDKIETGGTSTYREVAVHRALEKDTKKIFDSLGWNGLAMCEFKVCPETGKYWFIEVNPRMWGSISLAIESGVQFPYLAWLCATEGSSCALKFHSSSSVKTQWKARWLLGDIFVFISQLSKLNLRTAWRIFRENKPDSVDDFFWDDPNAFIGEVLAYVFAALKKGSTNPSEKGMIG